MTTEIYICANTRWRYIRIFYFLFYFIYFIFLEKNMKNTNNEITSKYVSSGSIYILYSSILYNIPSLKIYQKEDDVLYACVYVPYKNEVTVCQFSSGCITICWYKSIKPRPLKRFIMHGISMLYTPICRVVEYSLFFLHFINI